MNNDVWMDEDDLVFDVAYKTEAFINSFGNITIRQHNNLNENDEYQDVMIEIPLHHLDLLISQLRKIRDDHIENIEANEG